MIGIYKIISPSGKIYIGQSWNISRRVINYRKLYCKTQNKLYNSLKKYGWENHKFEIIHELPPDITQEILDSYEFVYLEIYKNCDIEILNLRNAGSRGKHSGESIIKMRGKPRIFSLEVRERISKSVKEYYKFNGSNLSKSLVQKDLEGNIIQSWISAREAERKLKIKASGISRAAKGKNKYNLYKNFIWEFSKN